MGPTGRNGESALARSGRWATQIGLSLVGISVPVALATGVVVVGGEPSLAAGLATAGRAVTGPLGESHGVAWALHLGVLGVLLGAWLVGFGFVASGLSEGYSSH